MTKEEYLEIRQNLYLTKKENLKGPKFAADLGSLAAPVAAFYSFIATSDVDNPSKVGIILGAWGTFEALSLIARHILKKKIQSLTNKLDNPPSDEILSLMNLKEETIRLVKGESESISQIKK